MMAANPHPCAMPEGVCMSMFIESHIPIERDFFCCLVRKFLPHWESGGCWQSSRASRKILLVSLEGCDRVTDIDCTECTCSGQVVRQQVVVMVLVRYGQRSIKK